MRKIAIYLFRYIYSVALLVGFFVVIIDVLYIFDVIQSKPDNKFDINLQGLVLVNILLGLIIITKLYFKNKIKKK